MNLIIKRVVVSVALLQTVCSQAFTEFVNSNELTGRVIEQVTEQITQEAPKGYMEKACDLWSRRPSMPTMPSISIPKISIPSISMPKVSMPSFSMPSMPASVTSGYESAKTFVTPYAKSFSEAVAPHITLQNGKYAAAGVAVLAGLYVVRKYIEKIPVDKPGNPIIVQGRSEAPARSYKEQIIDAVLQGKMEEAIRLVKFFATLTPEEKMNAMRLIGRYFSFINSSKQNSNNQDQLRQATDAFDLLGNVLDKCA